MLRSHAGAMEADDGLRPIFEHTASLGSKDLQLAQDLARELGLDAPFAELAAQRLRVALGLDAAADVEP